MHVVLTIYVISDLCQQSKTVGKRQLECHECCCNNLCHSDLCQDKKLADICTRTYILYDCKIKDRPIVFILIFTSKTYVYFITFLYFYCGHTCCSFYTTTDISSDGITAAIIS
ncbi:hypothetical protein ACF0H5_024243 [Mactra antiquata]